jgi:two-component system sensor histidine kinase MprB
LLTSGAVAVAILAASVAAWFLIRSTLLDDVDDRLLERVPQLEAMGNGVLGSRLAELRDSDQRQLFIQGDPIGVQAVSPDGKVAVAIPPGDVELTLEPEESELLAAEPGTPWLRTEQVAGATYRVLSVSINDDLFLRMLHPLEGVERTMTRMTWMLVAVAVAGVGVAGAVGWTISRAGLRPVDDLAEAAEQVAATRDLAHRIDVDGDAKDEVARLGRSVNAMLAALDSAQTQQRQLVEDAGHELRTPLATLRNDLGLLLRSERHPDRTLDADDRAGLLRDLESEAVVLSDLVAELVDLARGEVEPEPLAETDFRTVIDRAVARTRRVNPDVEITIRGERLEGLVRPDSLERAVANLVRNAVQVSADGGRVRVELDERDGFAVVRVLDRGPGIAEHDLPRIFDRFYRGEDARERQGSGLGLAIVTQVAALHGGSVEAENRDGGGAAFILRVSLNGCTQGSPGFSGSS